MYSINSNLVLCFHGCDEIVRNKVISGNEELKISQNDFDWLGHGIYFWENNSDRAFEYALSLSKYPKNNRPIIKNPSVIGAVIDLGNCLDLLNSKNLKILKNIYNFLDKLHKQNNDPLPQNLPNGLRKLDCAVIEMACQYNDEHYSNTFDSVRGVFTEGKELYPTSGFHEKDHIQICIRNPNCIKGFFALRDRNPHFNVP